MVVAFRTKCCGNMHDCATSSRVDYVPVVVSATGYAHVGEGGSHVTAIVTSLLPTHPCPTLGSGYRRTRRYLPT